MGLFIGASFLSIVELVELMFSLINRYKQKRARNRKLIENMYNKKDDGENSVGITKIST